MGLTLTQNTNTTNKTEIELIPEGTHDAVLMSVVGEGTQPTPFENEDGTQKFQQKVRLGFALPNVTYERDNGDGTTTTTPRFITKQFTLSAHKQSNLLKTLVTWRNHKKIDAETTIDLESILTEASDAVATRQATVVVSHATSKTNGNTFAVVDAITAMDKKGNHNTGDLETTYFSFEKNDDGTYRFTSIPETMSDYRILTLTQATEWDKWFANATKNGYTLPDGVIEKMG